MILFSDIHLSRGVTLELAKQALSELLDFSIKNNEQDWLFLGDWFDSRVAVPVPALKFSFEFLQHLEELKINLFILAGNHDYYNAPQASQWLSALEVFKRFKNVHLIIQKEANFTVESIQFFVSPFAKVSQLVDVPEQYSPQWKNPSLKFLVHVDPPSYSVENDLLFRNTIPLDKIKVFSGHWHNRAWMEKFQTLFLGSLYAWNWTHKNSLKGFWQLKESEIKFYRVRSSPIFLELTPVKFIKFLRESPQLFENAIVKLLTTKEELKKLRKLASDPRLKEKLHMQQLMFEVIPQQREEASEPIAKEQNPYEVVKQYVRQAAKESNFNLDELEQVLADYLLRL